MNTTFGNSPDAPAQMRRGRPRSEQSRAAALRATSELLQEVGAQAKLNHRPRRVLGWSTPTEAFGTAEPTPMLLAPA
jgi:IS30 family transposase